MGVQLTWPSLLSSHWAKLFSSSETPHHHHNLLPAIHDPQGGPDAFSTEPQSCRLAVTSAGRAYLSKDAYPCALVVDPESKLGGGKCFGAPEHA
jgi:hypothetical protein